MTSDNIQQHKRLPGKHNEYLSWPPMTINPHY